MKRFIISSLLIYSTIHAHAQVQLERNLLSSGGVYATSANIILEYSIGEPMVTSRISPSVILTEGFHQSNNGLSSINYLLMDSVHISLYPNPVMTDLHISLLANSHTNLIIELMDIYGRTLQSVNTILKADIPAMIYLDTKNLAAGTYLLRCTNQSKKRLEQNFKLLKL